MSWTIETALADSALEKYEVLGDVYTLWLKGIPVPVRIELSANAVRGGYNFQLSHYIQTPRKTGPHYPARTWDYDRAGALHLAVAALTEDYKEAVLADLIPNAEWLVPNKFGI
jgi:hypothetical protein